MSAVRLAQLRGSGFTRRRYGRGAVPPCGSRRFASSLDTPGGKPDPPAHAAGWPRSMPGAYLARRTVSSEGGFRQ
jgi:hypothetical protein